MIDMVSSNNTFANNSMIFKTIDSSVDNTRKTLALFNKDWNTYKTNWQQGFSQNGVAGGIKSIFQSSNSNSVISKDQLQILRNWNNAVAHGCTNQETFNRIIKDADSNTKLYFSGLNKGKGSVEGLKNAQNVAKQSTIGLTLAQTALNAAISLGFTAALMLAVKGLDKLINSAKRASEAADEAFSDTTEKVQKNEEEAKSLDELISKYKELKESGNLDVDGRKEIKEIQNDIADLVGVQASNLDLVNGKLDDEIAKLDEISAKEAKNAYETATANYNNSKKATDKAAGDDSFLFIDGYSYTGKREKEAEKVLKNAGFGGNVQSGGFFGNTLFIMDSFDNDMKELKGAQEKADYLQSMIDVLEQNGQRATDLYAGLISQRDKYLQYIDNQQDAANSLVNSWISYSQFSNDELSKINVDSLDSFEEYRQKMIEEAKNDESIGKMLADGTLSDEDLENTVNDFMATSTKFSTWYEQWIGNIESDVQHETPTSFEIPDADTLKQQISDLNSAIDSIQSAYDTLNSAVEEYNSNGGQLSIDTIQSLLSLSDEYLACLQVENGQLSLNADAMAQLAQAKLDEAQATAVTQAMTELQAIANGEAAQSTTNYITGNAALMSSLAQLSGSYEGVAQAAMTAAQAQELSAQISAASAKDKTATENVMKGLDTKLKLIQSTKNAISAGNFASVAKKSSSSGSSSKSSKDELKEAFETEYNLLKHNLEMETITEKEYYDGVQALNEKYFAGKKEYLDEYRKYEEEVYKGLKSYYKSYCDDMMDYYDKKLDASKMSYKEYCDSVSKMLADMHNSGKISDKDWYDYTKTMLEKQKDAYDRALSAITRRLQKEIDAWQAKIDALNDQNDALNDQKDNYDKILSAVSNVYDKEIDRLNEQKDLLQDQIDALNDKNDALDLQYRKEQALYALQKAQQQRTRKLYVEGKGYIYDTDNEAIRDAQKDLDDITNEELINSLQKEQDKIQESIDILEKYKEKWNEIPDAWDKAVSEQLAIELWGQEYEKLILMNRTSDIENFKTKYLKIQSQINDNEQLIKSYEEKVEYYTKLKEQWQSLTDEYSNSVDDMYAKMLLGQSWESDVLNGRLSTLNDFRNQYNDIQKSISDMAWQSANAQISALNAVKAAEATKAQTSGGSNGYSGSSGNVSSVSKPSQPQKDTVQHYWIYRTLGTFNTNGQASSKIGMLGGDGVISVGGKYLVVKWKKGYVTRGEASSNIVNYGGNGVYKRYASGTDNAKKGWNIVSEENPELIIRNNGEIDLAKGEQFYNFQGGEKVIPANETKEILKNQGNVEQLSDSDVITRKDGSILKPIHYEYENMLTNFIKDNPDYMYSMNTMSDNMCRDLFKNAENVNYDNRSVDNKVSIGEIHLHEVPNVDQFARELDRQLAGIVDQKLSRRKR